VTAWVKDGCPIDACAWSALPATAAVMVQRREWRSRASTVARWLISPHMQFGVFGWERQVAACPTLVASPTSTRRPFFTS
jgi:hypothetical protein